MPVGELNLDAMTATGTNHGRRCILHRRQVDGFAPAKGQKTITVECFGGCYLHLEFFR